MAQSGCQKDKLLNWFSAEVILQTLGVSAVFGVAVIIFFETATILGSFLPGDSLLFLLGLGLATYLQGVPLWLALFLIFVAAVAGSQVGFWLGRKIGPRLFKRKQTWFFNERVIDRTDKFFVHYGARAIILARFVPVLRALIPMFTGMSAFDSKRFLRYNLIGGFAWVVGVTVAGFELGQISWVRANVELVILSFVLLSSLPLPFELARGYFKRRGMRG